MKIDKWALAQFAILAVIIAGLFWMRPFDEAFSTSTTILLTVAVIFFLRSRYPERYQKDERTIKTSSYAASWSWLVILIMVSVLFWIDYLSILEFEASDVILTIFLTQIISILVYRWYFARGSEL